MKIIGLMGNSGSGKSTVADYLQKRGAFIIDADALGREVCEIGQPGLKAIRETFGEVFLNDDGSLNRQRMGAYAFAHPDALKKLEGIVHPLVKKRVDDLLAGADSDIVVIDCAILVKTGLNKLADDVWLVMSDIENKIRRITERDGISPEEALARLNNQNDETILTRYADRIFDNNGTYESLISQVEKALGETENSR